MDYQRIYEEMGISPEVIAYSEKILKNLESRFKEIDEIAEINQLKVLQALQKAKVSEATTISEEMPWKRFTPIIFIPRMPWCVPRLSVEPMPWPLPCRETFVREMKFYPR